MLMSRIILWRMLGIVCGLASIAVLLIPVDHTFLGYSARLIGWALLALAAISGFQAVKAYKKRQ